MQKGDRVGVVIVSLKGDLEIKGLKIRHLTDFLGSERSWRLERGLGVARGLSIHIRQRKKDGTILN